MFVFIAFVLIATDAAKIDNRRQKVKIEKNIFTCAFNYLKENEMLDSLKFMNFEPNVDEGIDCDELLEEIRDMLYNSTKEFYEKDKEFTTHSECITEKLRKFNLGDAYLVSYLYTKDKTMSQLRREKAIIDATASTNLKKELAEDFCAPVINFGLYFDDLYGEDPVAANVTESDGEQEEEKGEEEDIEQIKEDYCHKKHIVDSKFIDNSIYNIEVNPKNISFVGLDCNKIWQETTNEYQYALKEVFNGGLNSPTPKEVRCILNTIKASKYSELLIRTWVFGELRITEQRKIVEKSAFITFMTNLYTEIIKCEKN